MVVAYGLTGVDNLVALGTRSSSACRTRFQRRTTWATLPPSLSGVPVSYAQNTGNKHRRSRLGRLSAQLRRHPTRAVASLRRLIPRRAGSIRGQRCGPRRNRTATTAHRARSKIAGHDQLVLQPQDGRPHLAMRPGSWSRRIPVDRNLSERQDQVPVRPAETHHRGHADPTTAPNAQRGPSRVRLTAQPDRVFDPCWTRRRTAIACNCAGSVVSARWSTMPHNPRRTGLVSRRRGSTPTKTGQPGSL